MSTLGPSSVTVSWNGRPRPIVFAAMILEDQVSETELPEDPPMREARQNVFLGARVCGFGRNAPTRHRIKDLSTHGARIDGAGALRAGATILISVGALEEIGATVVWVKDGAAGLRFAEPIDPAAARSRTIISDGASPAPGGVARRRDDSQSRPIGAGWATGLNSPYRP